MQRAWVIQSASESIGNVCKISRSVLVNKLQCEHIAYHFEVIGDVLTKLGLGKDFVSRRALETDFGIQPNLTFDKRRFSDIAETFTDHNRETGNFYIPHIIDSFLGYEVQDTSRMFKDYVRKLSTPVGYSEGSWINEYFLNSSFQRTGLAESCEAWSGYRVQHHLDQFLCLLLGVLKQGEDLVMFHSRFDGADKLTGLYGKKFVKIHKLLYELLDFYACLEHCEGTEFAQGYLYQLDSCRVQSLLYYLNSNRDEEYESLLIDDELLSIEIATALSELLQRPHCTLKTLFIEGSSVSEV